MKSKDTIRWGILGTGLIARVFSKALRLLPDANLLAVGSRSQESADEFAELRNIPRRYASYAELVNDPDIDVVYIATPHPFHFENAKSCLEAGKAVLCEKPFTVNAAEAGELVGIARANNLFLMEAMWVRFLPLLRDIKQQITEGRIGDLRMISSNYGHRFDWMPEHRVLNPDLAGGALLDVGVYPLYFSYFFFGETPQEILSTAKIGETGVDEENAMILRFSEGRLALLSSAVRTTTSLQSFIYGTEGYFQIYGPWWKLDRAHLVQGKNEEEIRRPVAGNGYQYEAQEVMDCLRAGKTESPVMPLDELLQNMKSMDAMRREWGLRYPFEQ